MDSSRPAARPFWQLSPSSRERVRRRLVDAARAGLAEGWQPDELDVLHSEARRLGVSLTRGAAAQMMADAVNHNHTT